MTLCFVKKENVKPNEVTEMTEKQHLEARKSWKVATRRVSTQLKVMNSLKGETFIARFRGTVWNLLHHPEFKAVGQERNDQNQIKTKGR